MNNETSAVPSRVYKGLSEHALRISSGSDSPFFTLLGLAADRQDLISLGMGEPDVPTPKHIIDAAKKALDDGLTTYTNPAGIPALREAIAEKLEAEQGLRYDPKTEIIVTTGAQEAMAVIMLTLLNPQEEVLLASPFYQAYDTNIKLAGGVPVGVPTTESDDFQMTGPMIEPLLTDRTKLLTVITPNNPTGAVLTAESLESISETARQRDLIVLSDEIYDKIVYDDHKHVSIASLEGMRERTIVINGFSKTYSMTGLRVGYMAGPADYIQAAVEPRHGLSISSPTPFQYAALAALTGPQDFIADLIVEYTERRNIMAAVFDELGVTYSLPRGAFYFWAKITGAGVSSFEFCRRGIEEHGLLFFPGSMYGEEGEGFIRISYLAPRDQLVEALERFARLYRECQATQ